MRKRIRIFAAAILIPALMLLCNVGALAEDNETYRAGPASTAETGGEIAQTQKDVNISGETEAQQEKQDTAEPLQTGGQEVSNKASIMTPGAEVLSPATVDPVTITVTSDKAEYYAGDTVTFTITISNTGSHEYNSVSVYCDEWQGDGSIDSVRIASNQNIAKNGGSKQFTATTIISQGASGDFTFNAKASGTYNGSPKTVTAQITITVKKIGIAITVITPSSLNLYPGDSAGFDVTVKNIGDVDLTGLVLSDSMASRYDSTAGITIAPGESKVVHGIVSIPSEDGVGSSTNTVTATAGHNGKSTSDSKGLQVNILLKCDITLNKTAVLTDSENRIAQVTLNISGTPPLRPVDAVLVIDRSASMQGTPLTKAKEAAKAFIDKFAELNPNNRVALVSYRGIGEPLQGLTSLSIQNIVTLKSEIDAVVADNGYNTNSGTNTMDGIQKAMDYLSGESGQAKAIVLLSDGLPNRPQPSNTAPQAAIDKANEAKAQGISVYSVGLFNSITNPNEKQNAINTLTSCASTGCYYDAADPSYLTSIFTRIATRINYIAQSAVVVDIVSDDVRNNFTVYEFTASQGDVQYNSTTGVITWSPGTVGGDGATLTYKVRADEDYVGKTGMHTNASAVMNYTDVNNTSQSEYFSDPVVDIPFRGKLTITKILKDKDGNKIAEPDREFAINIRGALNGGGSIEWNYLVYASDANGTSQLFKHLKAGTYTITEPYLPMGYRGQGVVTVTLGFDNPEEHVTVENRYVGNGYFTDDDVVDNLIDTSAVTSFAVYSGAQQTGSGLLKIVDVTIPDRKAMGEPEA